MNDSTSRKALNLYGAIKMRICLPKIIRGWTRGFIKAKAEMPDLGHRHGLPICGYHLREVLREGINLLLKEEKGGTDGTQLSFVNDKGEFLRGVVSASQLVLAGYWWMRRKQGG